MLYDPKWEVPAVKPTPFTVAGLIAWLEKQEASATYCYFDNGRCLMAQYYKAMGRPPAFVGGWFVRFRDGTEEKFPEGFDNIAVGSHLEGANRWTFGAALNRARALGC
jgi:hypothetical protein